MNLYDNAIIAFKNQFYGYNLYCTYEKKKGKKKDRPSICIPNSILNRQSTRPRL